MSGKVKVFSVPEHHSISRSGEWKWCSTYSYLSTSWMCQFTRLRARKLYVYPV